VEGGRAEIEPAGHGARIYDFSPSSIGGPRRRAYTEPYFILWRFRSGGFLFRVVNIKTVSGGSEGLEGGREYLPSLRHQSTIPLDSLLSLLPEMVLR
jgi:hypothetical protein